MTNLLILCTTALLAAGEHAAVDVDSTKQLFLDDELIASMHNVQRRIHQAKKSEANPVLWPSEPWEGNVAVIYGSVLRDGDKFRMWYHGGQGVSYAESDDGIHWTKPTMRKGRCTCRLKKTKKNPKGKVKVLRVAYCRAPKR